MTQPDPRALHHTAREAAARGWRVFPLRPDDKRPAGHAEAHCSRTGRCTGGHLKPEQRASTDPDLIEKCWSLRPYGVGIATGPSDLVVIDLDVPKNTKDAPDGATTFHALCQRTGQPLPTTYTVRTASGGRHLYFTAPPGARLRNTAGKLGPGIDTRAWGGYVVAAGSTAGGRPYKVTDPTPPTPLPAWLHTALTPAPPPRGPAGVPQTRDASAYAAAALRNETTNVKRAPEGSRNWCLTRAARALGRLIASGDLHRAVVEEALNGAATAAGLTEREAAATITSALNWSLCNNGGRVT